jgi:hypothetical protein
MFLFELTARIGEGENDSKLQWPFSDLKRGYRAFQDAFYPRPFRHIQFISRKREKVNGSSKFAPFTFDLCFWMKA